MDNSSLKAFGYPLGIGNRVRVGSGLGAGNAKSLKTGPGRVPTCRVPGYLTTRSTTKSNDDLFGVFAEVKSSEIWQHV